MHALDYGGAQMPFKCTKCGPIFLSRIVVLCKWAVLGFTKKISVSKTSELRSGSLVQGSRFKQLPKKQWNVGILTMDCFIKCKNHDQNIIFFTIIMWLRYQRNKAKCNYFSCARPLLNNYLYLLDIYSNCNGLLVASPTFRRNRI